MQQYNPFSNYGSSSRAEPWYNTSKYFQSKKWLENRPLDALRPSLQTLKDKKDLVGVEIGVGICLHSRAILDTLDVKKLYMIDLNHPPESPGKELVKDDRVEFWQGDSTQLILNLPEELDFAYVDASHDYSFVMAELSILLHKVKQGGLLAGHDFEQVGVNCAVMTMMCNLWRLIKKNPNLQYASCLDNHPGYPEEYLEYGFPLDWWIVKDFDLPEKFKLDHLRNG